MIESLLVASFVLAPVTEAPARVETEPHAALVASVEAVRKNDLRRFLQLTLPDAKLAELRAEWERQRAEGAKPAEVAQFRETMAKLTAPDAEAKLMQELAPKLAEMRPQVAMMTGMLTGMAQSGIEQSATLSATEKRQARELLQAAGRVLQEHDITDEAAARRAVAVVCRTARRLNAAELEQLQRLSFDQLLAKGDVVLGGLKEVLAIYGLEVDAWLDSVEAETVRQEGDGALVRVRYEILGVRQTVETEMVRSEGRWVRKLP